MVRRMLVTMILVGAMASPVLAQWPGTMTIRSGNSWFSYGESGPRLTFRVGDTTFRSWPGGSSTTTTFRFGHGTLRSTYGFSNGSSFSKSVLEWVLK